MGVGGLDSQSRGVRHQRRVFGQWVRNDYRFRNNHLPCRTERGALSLTGSGALNLTAPTTGPYSGILFFEDPKDTQQMKIAGSTGSTLTGIFYAPLATLSLTGSSGATFNVDLVTYALSISGTGGLNQYMSPTGTSPLSSARVVE